MKNFSFRLLQLFKQSVELGRLHSLVRTPHEVGDYGN